MLTNYQASGVRIAAAVSLRIEAAEDSADIWSGCQNTTPLGRLSEIMMELP
jgi:hypothetical protein